RLTTVDSVEYGAFSDKPRIAEGCRVIEEDGARARKRRRVPDIPRWYGRHNNGACRDKSVRQVKFVQPVTFVAILYCQSQITSSHGGQGEVKIVRPPERRKDGVKKAFVRVRPVDSSKNSNAPQKLP
ncbi:hypothetical protein PV326_013256, partial [Microctonus aethiopoides]